MNTSDESAVQETLKYLASDEALRGIEANPYWPKWHSPWWQMAALYGMGFAGRIPSGTVCALVAALKKQYPQDGNPGLVTPCPCELGNIYQILNATGVDVDGELPWIRPWFLRHQMSDGGLSCDQSAYHAHPQASSIVGTIAPLEAILFFTPRSFTPEEERFLDRGAACLIDRKLMLGCAAPHNAEERLDEEDWIKLCFPRFYFYDVLRGLNFILHWSEKRRKPLPADAIAGVMGVLERKFPEGEVRIERQSYAGVGTRVRTDSGEWIRSKTASVFPLLTRISEIGQVSPYLTSRWKEARLRAQRVGR